MSKKMTSRQFFTCTNPCCSIVVDLPPDAHLDDLASPAQLRLQDHRQGETRNRRDQEAARAQP